MGAIFSKNIEEEDTTIKRWACPPLSMQMFCAENCAVAGKS